MPDHDTPTSGPDRHDTPTAFGAPARPEPRIGEDLGPYRILEVIGQGGFGIVYLAEQREPVRRRVALKIVRPGMASDEVVARFEAERQALALMDHPGVAKVYDAGFTPGGLPYFAMEHVQGVPITEYCDTAGLGVESRVRLFADACRAVQHAHQKGILHRDLKPSNVLVALVDGKPVPKVIDFGIAKAMTSPLTERTLHTQVGRLLGTPEYMSPEQAGTSGLDVDTRTDVYSLGVMLYQLLTGMLPFDSRSLRNASNEGIRRLIMEAEPAKPSTKVATAGREAGAGEPGGEKSVSPAREAVSTARIARSRGTDPESLRKQLVGDLDWIVMKSLEKDRSRRYESPSALAADLERHLRHEAVLAGPPSVTYRANRFVRRHRLGVAAAGLFALVIMGSIVALGIMNATAIHLRTLAEAARAQADEQRFEAEREAARANAALGFVSDMFSAIEPTSAHGHEVTVREVLDKAQADAGTRAWRDPTVEATVRHMLAKTYHLLGRSDQAEQNMRRALQIRERDLGPRHADTLRARHDLAAVLIALSKFEEAKSVLDETIKGREAALGPDHPDTLASRSLAVALMQNENDYAGAEAPCRELLMLQEKSPSLGEKHRDTLDTRLSLADILGHLGKYDEAASVAGKAADLARGAYGGDDPATMIAMSIQSDALQETGKLEESEAIDLRLLDARTRVLGPTHRETLLTCAQLGDTYKKMQKWDKAEEMSRRAFEGAKASPALGPEHVYTLSYMHNLAVVLQQEKKFGEAAALLDECLTLRRRVEGPEAIPAYVTLNQVALLRMDEGRPAESLPILIEVRDGLAKKLPPTHWMHGVSRTCIGECLMEMNRTDEAEATLKQAYEMLVESQGASSARTRRAAGDLANLYDRKGNAAEAGAWKAKAGV